MTTADQAAGVAPASGPRFANRVLVWFVVVIVVLASVILVVLRTSLLLAEAERVEDALLQEVEELAALADGVDPETGEPFGLDVQRIFEVFLSRNIPAAHEVVLTFLDGRPHQRAGTTEPIRLEDDARAMATFAAAREPTRDRLDTAAGRVDYIAQPIAGARADGTPVTGTFVVAYFSDVAQAPTDRAIFTVTTAVAVAALALTAGVAFWLSRQLTRPLTAMAETAASLDPRDLSTRIAVPPDRELGSLARTINGMLDRIGGLVEAQKRFLDDAGHELRTPITIVSGHLDVLEDDPAERAATLEMVQDELARMARIVADLSTLATAEQPGFVNPGPVDVAALAARLGRTVRAIADRRWAVTTSGVSPGSTAVADEERLVQAVVALAENAARHTEDGGRIEICVELEGGWLRLHVIDDGVGIPPEVQPTLFDRFVRHGERRGGAGLGLSIVRSIAEGHGGHADVRSTPGAGARFTVAVPHQPSADDEEGAR